MQTKTKNGSKQTTLGKRGPGRPRKIVPTRTAEQIADSLEREAKRLQAIANDLRR